MGNAESSPSRPPSAVPSLAARTRSLDSPFGYSPTFRESRSMQYESMTPPPMVTLSSSSSRATPESINERSETPQAPPPTTHASVLAKGLPVNHLYTLVNQFGGRAALAGLSTAQVVDKFIRPMTSASNVSLCGYMTLNSNASLVQDAQYFISHSHSSSFLGLVDALESWALSNNLNAFSTIVWIDIFSLSQHSTAERDLAWFEYTQRKIQKIGNTVLVLDWANPIPLVRTWCLFEAWVGAGAGRLNIAISQKGLEWFLEEFKLDSGRFCGYVGSIDCEMSATTTPTDKQTLLHILTRDNPIPTINRTLSHLLASWITFTLQQQIANNPSPQSSAQYMYALANFHRLSGNLHAAEHILFQCLQKQKQVLGETHEQTLVTLGTLALVYISQTRFESAEPLLLQCCLASQRALGSDHVDTINATFNLAQFYVSRGRLDQAEPLFLEAIQAQKRVLGPTHPETVESITILANLYAREGWFEKALPLLKETIDKLGGVGPAVVPLLEAMEGVRRGLAGAVSAMEGRLSRLSSQSTPQVV
ncbi:WD repeat-containing protein 38 [Rhizoclosmatium sp. JEL0117]|nr:WD repeat-containing protein 38 [Rhizoclosmatium sp. JEL0117]